MRAFFHLALASLFVVLAARISAAPALINLIDENAPVVIVVQDVPELIKNWAYNPLARSWNDEQMKKFLAPLRLRMKVDEWDDKCKVESGYTVAELIAMAKGQALVALTSMDFPLGDAKLNPADLPLIIALEIGENAAKVAKIIAANDEKEHATVRTEDFAGVTLHIYVKSEENGGGEEFVWAMSDGIWFLSPSKITVQKSLDALQKGRAAAPLGESERFLQIKKQTGDANFTIVANMEAIYPAIQKAVEARAANGGAQPMGIAPGVLLSALGLDAIKDFYFGVNLSEAATEFKGGLTYSELRGILKLLAYHDGPVAQPDFVSAKWITVTTVRFSLNEAYMAIRELVNGVNPMALNLVDGQIKNLNTQLSVDLERDLFGSLGDEIIAANALRPGTSADSPMAIAEFDQLFALSLQNAGAFTKAVDALKRMMGPQADKLLEKREYLNQTIYSNVVPNPKPGQKGFSYSITPKYLFVAIGSPAVIETALQGLDGKQPTLWQQPEVKAALVDVPAKACTFEFQNTRTMMSSLVETLVQIAPMLASKAKADASVDDDAEKSDTENFPFDLSSKPDPATLAKYFSTSTGYAWRESHGLFFHSKINHGK